MKRSFAALAAVAALTLTACGSSSDTKTDSTAAAGSSQTSKADVPSAKVGDEVDAAELAKKTTDALKAAGTAKMSMDGGAQKMSGVLSYKDGVSYKMTMNIEGEAMEMVYVDKVFYMGGAQFAKLTGGKKFIKIDPKGTDPMSKMMAPVLTVMEQAANPAEILSTLDGVKAKVIAVEGGTTTYETKMTAEQLKKATEKMFGSDIPADALKSVSDQTLQQTVDAQGRLTKVTTKGTESSTITYSDYGVPVDIKAPAASEVGTFEMPKS